MERKAKDNLDRFYTKESISKWLINEVDIHKYKEIIEPSAGNGSFSKQIKNCIAFDIFPTSDNIIEQDFLKLEYVPKERPVLVIGNPPFGRQGSLAIKFFNHAAKFADTMAFILPPSFGKQSVQKKLNPYFKLAKTIFLPAKSFLLEGQEIDIPAIFQIWHKSASKRNHIILKPLNYVFVDSIKYATFAVRRVGGTAGKIIYPLMKEPSKSSHYFVKLDEQIDINQFLEKASTIDWQKYYKYSLGPRTIAKQEFIKEFNHIIEEIKQAVVEE